MWRRRAMDITGPVLLCLAGQLEIWTDHRLGGIGAFPESTSHGPLVVLALVATVILIARRRLPMLTAFSVGAALGVQLVFVVGAVSLIAGLLPLLVATYSAAAYAPARWRAVPLGVALVVQALFAAQIPEERTSGEVIFGVFVITGSWLVGIAVAQRAETADRALTAAIAVRQQELLAILDDERARIAHELHDVISHGVSVMGVQAAAARVQLQQDPATAAATLLAVEQQARDSMAELQRLLGVLRDPGTDDREPQPGLARLLTLVETMRSAGLPVTVRVVGTSRQLPAGADLTAYRVIQESLTNTLKHAGAVPVEVLMVWTDDELRIDVNDAGTSRAASNGTGHGLIGMRERVAMFGGTVQTSREPDGFRVSALLPLGESAG